MSASVAPEALVDALADITGMDPAEVREDCADRSDWLLSHGDILALWEAAQAATRPTP